MLVNDSDKKSCGQVRLCEPVSTRDERNSACCPPLSNRGGAETVANHSIEHESFERYTTYLTNSKGQLLEVPLRCGKSDSAFIDQISFSVHEDTFSLLAGYPLVSDDEYVIRSSMVLHEIFGFGISEKANHKGGRFYDACWLMGTDNAQYGRVHFGGQNNTMLFELTATGCMAALDGWELRLYDFITKSVRPKITRVDVAKDFFNGEYTPERAKADRLDGKFTNHKMMPDGESVGTDWESNNGKGKTYYIGSRESSKYVRVYEKGKQLGDKSSNWVRFEIEFKAKDIVIPFEVLTAPGEYFGGAYPVCRQLSFKQSVKRIYTVDKVLQLTFERCIAVAKQQVGRAINAAKAVFPERSDEQILAMFKPDHDLLPKRLNPECFSAQFNDAPSLHEQQSYKINLSEHLDFLLDMKIKKQNQMDELRRKKHEEDYWNFMYSNFAHVL